MKVSFRDCQKVTNSALVYVKAVPRVTLLILAGTQVTDAGLRHLKDTDSAYLAGFDENPGDRRRLVPG